MKLAQSVRAGAWLLVGLNLLMALGSVWVFMRMAPAIEVIIDRNDRSIYAGEVMLASLAMMTEDTSKNESLKESFMNAMKRAQNNITEESEPAVLALINQNFLTAFQGDIGARESTVSAITRLGEINRDAMILADKQARQFGYAGAWVVVFMAVSVFFAGILFIRSLRRNLVKPLEEMHAVVSAHRNGDTMRRCVGADLPKDIKAVFDELNEFLDNNQAQILTTKNMSGTERLVDV